jgi:dihydropteroate synthase
MSRLQGWRIRSRVLSLERPLVMGVLNVTPDSFSDGGRYIGLEAALDHAHRLWEEGADLIDVGGESTRPGAAAVGAAAEGKRILGVVEKLVGEGITVSVDTSKAVVAEAALAAGAEVINDVTAGADPGMFPTVAAPGAGLVLMHMRGSPRTMQADPQYQDVVGEVAGYLASRAKAAVEAGVEPDRICLDPGIGFGKTVEHNLEILRRLPEFAALGHPLAIGVSRKSFLGRLTGVEDPRARDLASAVAAALAVERGAQVLRVHNVAACREALGVALAIVRESGGRWSSPVSNRGDSPGS